MENIHPIFDTILKKEDKEQHLKQKAGVFWFIGLSGSGKSTLVRALEHELHKRGYLTKMLDGDNLRTGINNNLGFSEEDRTENIRRASEVAKLFMDGGVITLCSLITPSHTARSMAKMIIGPEFYHEVYVSCPVEICEQRDVKGLYAKARKGEIKNFTGIDAPFEEPSAPELVIQTDLEPEEVSLQKVLKYILPIIEKKQNQ